MLNEEEKKSVTKKLQLLSKHSKADIQEMLEALVIQMMFDYLEGKETYIPLIGSFKFQFKGDEIVDGTRRAIVRTEFTIDEFLQRVIGQAEDNEETEVEKIFKEKIRQQLTKYLS